MSSPTDNPAVYVGQCVAKARMAANMTQLELAHKIGLAGDDAGAAISRLETGAQEPRLAKLIQIAKVLKVPLESLLPV